MRRLPIYLLIDTSESMVGEPIQAVESGLAEMLLALRRDPYALEMAYLSVITFGTTAKQITPLTELIQFQTPKLILGSGTALGAGLELLEKRLDGEVVKTTANDKGDYRPLVFLFTDGEPTDSWQAVADRFMRNRRVLTVAVGCGLDTNYNTLRRITETVIAGDKADQQTLSTFFKFVSSSIATASASVDATGETKISLAKLPVGNGIKIVDASTPQPKIEAGKYVFLHCKCQKMKQFYLMKYVKNSCSEYDVTDTFKLDNFETSTTGGRITISADLLSKVAPCPYCGNPRVGQCKCGNVLCLPKAEVPKPLRLMVTAPHWDNMQKVLDGMKLSYSHFKGKIDCDIFFLNCGSSDMGRIDNQELNRFVKNGGILYVSDLAYPNVEQAFPGLMTFKGSSYDGNVKADVEDNELKDIVGKTVNIYFDLVPFTVDTISCGKVILRAYESPIMVVCPYGKGKVFYTTFHNHQQTDKKEKALLELLLLKQLGGARNVSLQEISGELNVNLRDYQKTFGTQNAAINTVSSSGGHGTRAVCPWCGQENTYSAGTSIGGGGG